MPLFINRDQIFAHQLHLLEHKLRSKEERILELETENALLHLRLAECLKKLRHESVKESHVQRWKLPVLSSLLSEVQVLKQDLRNILTSYMGFAGELQEQSRKLLQLTCTGRITDVDLQHSPDVQKLQTCVASLQEALQEEKDRCRQEKLRRRMLHNTLVELRGNIRVHCRLRPVLHLDHLPGSSTASEAPEAVLQAVSDDSVLVNCVRSFSPAPNKVFEFERVHGPEDDQAAVFDEVKPLLTSLLDGYNVCIMAYGQTGSGKTHTMIGAGPESESQSGIIPKAAGELFRLISQKPLDSHQVEMSVLEVYNNEILDLLARDESGSVEVKREVLTTSSGSSDVPGLTYQ